MGTLIFCKIGGKEHLAGFSAPILDYGRIHRLLEPKELGNVLMEHRTYYCSLHRTNVPRVFTHSDQDAWGYCGQGPTCFAQNILFHFTGGNEIEVKRLAGDFREDVLLNFPNSDSCLLLGEFVQKWIQFYKSPQNNSHGAGMNQENKTQPRNGLHEPLPSNHKGEN